MCLCEKYPRLLGDGWECGLSARHHPFVVHNCKAEKIKFVVELIYIHLSICVIIYICVIYVYSYVNSSITALDLRIL